MFSKTALSFAVLAVAQVALAQPYCLLTAVNKFEHPADQKTLCCSAASQVKSYIAELCPSADKSDAVDAFNTACKESGYGSCSSSSSSVTSASETGSASKVVSGHGIATSAPYPVVFTSTYYDTECSCTKTTSVSSSISAGSTGFLTGTAPVATGTPAASASGAAGASSAAGAATGSPIAPVAPSKTGSSTSPSSSAFTGAASKNVGSVAAGLLAVAAIAMAL